MAWTKYSQKSEMICFRHSLEQGRDGLGVFLHAKMESAIS